MYYWKNDFFSWLLPCLESILVQYYTNCYKYCLLFRYMIQWSYLNIDVMLQIRLNLFFRDFISLSQNMYHITDCKVFLDLQNLTSRMVFGAIVWTVFFLVKLQRHTSKWKYLKPEVKENLLSTCEYTTYLIFCLAWFWGILIKFGYSGKATKFEKIFHLNFCGLLGISEL